MEPKKNKAYDLERKTPLFFSIGLIISLSLTIAAFEWKGEYEGIVLEPKDDIFDEPYLVPTTEIPMPKPPEPVAKKVTKISNQPPVIVEGDIPEILKKTNVAEPVDFDKIAIEDVPPAPKADEVFIIVESMPEYPGGWNEFYKYVGQNLKYPKKARRTGVEGKVTVEFVIDKDGSITDIEILKGLGFGCDEEVKRILQEAEKFIPGKQRGVPVKVRQTLPIYFRLN